MDPCLSVVLQWFILLFFCWGGFQGEKVLCQMNWSPICAKLSSTLPPFLLLFLMYHHKSMQSP